MRKLLTHAFGSLDQLELVELPDLTPEPGQIVIDVAAAGVNFVDALIVQGAYQFLPPLPHSPGSEVAGTVAAVGDGVTGFEIGQRVVGLPASGGYASQVAVSHHRALPLPDGVSMGQAASLVQSYATALYALDRRTTIREGEWVAILGAGGGVGTAATDVAGALGAQVIACASSQEKLELARSLGAVATINYESEDLKTAIRERTGGEGADVIVDPIGGDKADAALRALRWDGRYLVIGFAAGHIPKIPLNQVLLNSRNVLGIELGGWARRDPQGFIGLVSDVLTHVGEGSFNPPEPTAFPLDQGATVLADLQQRRLVGKAVLTTSGSPG